jgi:serine/threonine protein kinase
MSSLEAGVLIGDFRIERRLGAGGMGIVYLARQLSLDRPVALKVLGSAISDPSAIGRFRREAQAIARLHHEGIADVYFIGQDSEVSYIAMEYIDGASLGEVVTRLASSTRTDGSVDSIFRDIRSHGVEAPEARFDQPTATIPPQTPGDFAHASLPTAQATGMMTSTDYIRRCCEIVKDTAIALTHAHERGVIHRDIKPDNLILDRRGHVHVIDFGLARFFEDATLTSTGALVGTPMYMSPEQVTGRLQVDHRTDIYSLGLVLYELLSLRKPIVAATREGVLRQIVTKPLPPVTRLNRAVPPDLEAVVHKATTKDPDERYQGATDLAEDLGRLLRGERVRAPAYRYRFDARQIASDRPPGVTFAAFAFFFSAITALCFAAFWGSTVLDIYRESGAVLRAGLAIALGATLTSVACLLCGSGLLAGRTLARRLGIALLAAFCTLCLKVCIEAFLLGVGSIYVYFIFPNFVVSLIALPLLFRPRARDWFREARRLRREHGRLEGPVPAAGT